MTVLTAEALPASGLTWPGASDEQLEFMRRVYDRHVRRASRRRPFVADVPDDELDVVEGGHRLRRDAAAAGRALLSALRRVLAEEQAAGRPDALAVQSVGVASGYRPATRQLSAWSSAFPRYYGETAGARAALPDGPHGDGATELLARYVGARLGAPGFSLHNDGRALDLAAVEGGMRLRPSTKPQSIRAWRQSWTFRHLEHLAPQHGFAQNLAIDEPWHWEHRGPAANARPEQEPVWQPRREPVPAGRHEVERVDLLSGHRGSRPDLVLRWNEMPGTTSRVDIVVHLHGYSGRGAAMRLPRDKEPYSGLDWSDPDRPGGASGRIRPTVGILPRGNFFGGRSGSGYDHPALAQPGALDEVVRIALREVAARTGLGELSVERLVVTAHSGGGAALERVLRHSDPDEVHVFDGTYGRPARLVSWASRRLARDVASPPAAGSAPSGALRVLYIAGTATEPNALALRRALAVPPALSRWYRVEATRVGHNHIPRRFGWQLLADAGADLAPPARPAPGPPERAEHADDAERSGRRPRTTSELRRAWARYRCAESEMVRMRVLSHRTPVNPLALDAYAALDAALRSTGYQARRTWAYNCRPIAGSTAYSLHSYGVAVDIDPEQNPHRRGTMGAVRFSPRPTQQQRAEDVATGVADTVFTPEQVGAVEAVRTVDGSPVWAWGGRWRTSHDCMHFQIDCTPDELARGIDPGTVPAAPAQDVDEGEACGIPDSADLWLAGGSAEDEDEEALTAAAEWPLDALDVACEHEESRSDDG